MEEMCRLTLTLRPERGSCNWSRTEMVIRCKNVLEDFPCVRPRNPARYTSTRPAPPVGLAFSLSQCE